jgi:hypothetical protein
MLKIKKIQRQFIFIHFQVKNYFEKHFSIEMSKKTEKPKKSEKK